MNCAYCDKLFGDAIGDRATRDHIIPKSFGNRGRGNVVPVCRCCNETKGNHTPASLRAFAADLALAAARYRNMADRVDALMIERGLSL